MSAVLSYLESFFSLFTTLSPELVFAVDSFTVATLPYQFFGERTRENFLVRLLPCGPDYVDAMYSEVIGKEFDLSLPNFDLLLGLFPYWNYHGIPWTLVIEFGMYEEKTMKDFDYRYFDHLVMKPEEVADLPGFLEKRELLFQDIIHVQWWYKYSVIGVGPSGCFVRSKTF